MGGYAWVTLATNNSYSLGALVLAHSLKRSNTAHKLVVLISPAVSEPMREQLQTVFDLVKVVDVLDSKDEAHLALMKRPDLGITFTKIHCWRLVEFEKCVFLDADTLVVRNCDELFEREEFSAAPDVSWPDCFNSGVFVYRPSIETFNKLLQFAVENRSFDGGDQGLLNQFFSEWATEDIKKHLPFVYNLTSIAAYSYIPAFKHYGSETRIVHFIGEGKPWLQQLDVATRTVVPSTGSEHLAPLLQQWWDVFCEKVHPNLDKSLESNNDGMPQPHVDACSNSVDSELTDETQSARLTEPCTPYREKDDFRQYNLPYQPFDVKGSSGELLNVEFMLVSGSERGNDDPAEGDKREESFESNSEGDKGGQKEVAVEEKKEQDGGGGGKETEEEPVREEGNNGDEGKKVEDGDQNQKEEPPPVKEEQDRRSFFPDENYIKNYMEQNVMMYQPFENHHETHRDHHHEMQRNHHHETHRDHHNESHREREPEQEVVPLQRFLAIPEDDQRQSGNVHNMEQEYNNAPKPAPPAHPDCPPPPPRDNPSPREPTPPPKEQPPMEKRELSKSKSMSYIASDFNPTEVSPPRSIWKSQPNLNVDPNRRFSMPKLKPILPKQNSFTKSVPSEMPKVTLYTEFLMSSEYKDPVDLPKDKTGFVESHIHKEGRLRRCKSDADIRSKFGPLPYVSFPEVQKPVIPKKFPPRHLDNEVYDLSKCKRQMGNKPKPKNADEGKENVRMLPALKPIAPAKDKTSTLIKKRKSKELSPGVGGREKMQKREPKTGRERKRESKVTPRNVSTSTSADTLDQILQKLREFSKDYQHFFGVTWGDKKKTVKCKNAEVQAGEKEDGESRASESFETVLRSVNTRTTETQTAKDAKQDGAEFRQFRNYVKDKRETSQKGLLSIQDILGEFEQPGTEVDGTLKMNSRVLRAEMTAGQREDDATPAQEYAISKTVAEAGGSDIRMIKALSKEEIEGKSVPDLDLISRSQIINTTEIQKDEETVPEPNSSIVSQSRSLAKVQEDKKTFPEPNSISTSQNRSPTEEQEDEKTFPETHSNRKSQSRGPAEVQKNEKTFPESNSNREKISQKKNREEESQSRSLTEVKEDKKTFLELNSNSTSQSGNPAEVQKDEETFPETNFITTSQSKSPTEEQEEEKTDPESKTTSTSESRSLTEVQESQKTFPESNPNNTSPSRNPAEVQENEKAFPESNSSTTSQSRSLTEVQKDEKTFPESNSNNMSQGRSPTEMQENEKAFPEANSNSISQSSLTELQETEKTFPESNYKSTPSRSLTEVQKDEETVPESNSGTTSQSRSLTEVQETEKTFPDSNSISTSQNRSHTEVQEYEKTFPESISSTTSQRRSLTEVQEDEKTFPEPNSNSTSQSRSLTEVQEDKKTFPESNSNGEEVSQKKNREEESQSISFTEVLDDKKTFPESNSKPEDAQTRLLDDSSTKQTSKELDSAATKSEKDRSNSGDIPKTPENVDDKSNDSLDSSQFPSPELQSSHETKSEDCSTSPETPETTKELGSEAEKSEEVRPHAGDSSEVFQTPQNGDTSKEHFRTNGCDHPEQNGRKSEDSSPTAKTTTEPQTTKNGVRTEDAVVEPAVVVSSHVITQPLQEAPPEREGGKPQQQKPKNPNEILCVPDFETPRSSRVALPTPKTGVADHPETNVAADDRKSTTTTTVPQRNGEANGLDSPEGTVRIAGKKRSGRRKTSPPSPKPCTPQQNGGGQDLNGGSGIAGAIAQLSLDAGAQTGGSAAASAAQQEYLRRQNWETGNMDYMGRDSFDNIWSKICQTLEAKETEEAAAGGGGSPGQTTAEENKPAAIPPTEDPVSLATILQKCPEFIETLPGEPLVAGPVEDDEIIFSKPESRQQSALTNIAEDEEGRTESAEATGNVKLSDILQPGQGAGSKSDQKVGGTAEVKVEGAKEKVQAPVMPTTQITPPTPIQEQVQPPVMPTAEKTTASPKAEQAPPSATPVQPPVAPPAEKTQPSSTTEGSKGQPPATPTAMQVTSPVAPAGEKSSATPATEKTPPTPAAQQAQPLAAPTAEKPQPPAAPTAEKVALPATPTAEKIPPPVAPEGTKAQPPATPTSQQVPTAPTAAQVPPPTTPAAEKSPSTPTAEKAPLPPTPTAVQPPPPVTPTAENTTASPKAEQPPPAVAPTGDKAQPPAAPPAEKIPPSATPATPAPSQAPTSPTAAQVPLPATPTAEKPEVPPAEGKPSEHPQPTSPTPEAQPTAEKKTCTTVAIPSPPITFPGSPFEEKGKTAAGKGKKQEDKPEVKSEPIPLPPPDSPAPAPTQEPTATVPDAPKEEAKQKKGVFTKILEMVGVAPKEKNGSEAAKSVFYDVQGVAEEAKEVEQASEVKEKPEEKGSDVPEAQKMEELPPPKAEEAVKKEEKVEQEGKKEEKGKQGQAPKQKPARGPQEGKKGGQASRKSPSPKLTIPQSPPATAVTTPTPPPQAEVPPKKSSGLLKVEDTILDTPPVTEAPKESVAEVVKGKVDDIIGKAKSEVESLLQDRRSAEKEVGESTDLINTMKLMVGAEEPGKAEEEVEELKVTSEEDRKRHKGETVSSKLSDQILKAIPPPRRKAISEASASTSSIPKATTAPEQQKPAQGEGKSAKPSKPSSIPVPPPRSRGKPSPPKGKGKK